MIALLEQIEAWHWIVLGLCALGAEALGVGGFLIGIGVAALLQGGIITLFPQMSWQNQLMIYAVDAFALSLIYWKFFRGFNNKTDNPDINNRAKSLVGRTVTLDQDIEEEGRIQIGDTFWNVRTDTALTSGDKAKVIDIDGMTLIIQKK